MAVRARRRGDERDRRCSRRLNQRFGAYGVGRGHLHRRHDGRPEGSHRVRGAGASSRSSTAHRALEEADAHGAAEHHETRSIARKWVELVYKGFFFEPLKDDLEAYLRTSQRFVTGEVTLETEGGSVLATAIESAHILRAKDATYAQVAGWTAREAEGFIRLLGQSASLSATINPRGT